MSERWAARFFPELRRHPAIKGYALNLVRTRAACSRASVPAPEISGRYADRDFPLYRGTNVSAMNVSRDVGVVLARDRGSRARMWPEFSEADISSRRSAILADMPICK